MLKKQSFVFCYFLVFAFCVCFVFVLIERKKEKLIIAKKQLRKEKSLAKGRQGKSFISEEEPSIRAPVGTERVSQLNGWQSSLEAVQGCA